VATANDGEEDDEKAEWWRHSEADGQ